MKKREIDISPSNSTVRCDSRDLALLIIQKILNIRQRKSKSCRPLDLAENKSLLVFSFSNSFMVSAPSRMLGIQQGSPWSLP